MAVLANFTSLVPAGASKLAEPESNTGAVCMRTDVIEH